MSFLNPYLLWGLLALSIPVIIHLFNFRKFRKVYFTNVRFLEELQQQTKRQSQFRHLLVMALRMLAIASLVLAFSQPYIPAKESGMLAGKDHYVSVYIDNSFSMESLATGGPLIELAKSKARDIVLSFRSSDLFSLVTNDFEARHQRWLSREEFLQALEEVAISPAVRKISAVAGRQQDMLYSSGGTGMSSYLVSDFQTSVCDFENIAPDSLIFTWLVPLTPEKKENLFIDSCWFASPVHQVGQGVKLVARIVNLSETDYEKVPLKLSVNGQQRSVAGFDIIRGSYQDVELPFTNHDPGIQYGTLEISDYPIIFDDRLYLVFNVAGSIPVLAINGSGESKYLDALFGMDSIFTFVNNASSNIDYNRLPGFNLVILNELETVSSGLAQELTNYLENGGTILIIPGGNMDVDAFKQFLAPTGANYYTGQTREETRVSAIDRQNPVFTDVFEDSRSIDPSEWENTDWPKVHRYFNLTRSLQSSQQGIMTLLNGHYFLTRELAGNGTIYLLTVSLDESFSNFASHAVFVPALYRMALLSAATDPLYYTIGRDQVIELSNTALQGDRTLTITTNEGTYEFIPGHQGRNRRLSLTLNNQVREAGHYQLKADREILKGLGFNYDRTESMMEFNDAAGLEGILQRYLKGSSGILSDKGKPLSETLKDMNQGTILWKLFIILALVFLAIEIILLRFWK